MFVKKFAQLAKLIPLLPSAVKSYHWPSPQYDALEMTLYEGQSPTGGLVSLTTQGCQSRVAQNGPPVAAEWLRLVSECEI